MNATDRAAHIGLHLLDRPSSAFFGIAQALQEGCHLLMTGGTIMLYPDGTGWRVYPDTGHTGQFLYAVAYGARATAAFHIVYAEGHRWHGFGYDGTKQRLIGSCVYDRDRSGR